MKKIFITIIIFLGIFIAIMFFFKFNAAQDSCLDNGGCWDRIDKMCRKSEPNAQELCDRKEK